MTRLIFADTETTGFGANNGGRIVEIGAVADNGSEYHTYLNPEANITYGAYNTHGLSEDFLADKPLFADIADDFINFIRGAHLIFHNAPFDRSFIDAELQRIGKPPLQSIAAGIHCTLKWSRANNRSLYSHKLDALCDHFGIDISARDTRHGALIDSHLLAKLYRRMSPNMLPR